MKNRTRVVLATALALGLAVLAARGTSMASDHRDSASLAADPSVDIADVFAFMRPEGTSPHFVKSHHLVAVMTVHPSASNAAIFEPGVDYTLSIIGLDDPSGGIPGALDAAVTCRFYAPVGTNDAGLPAQEFTCAANGQFFAGVTNEVKGASTDALRVFAGLRSDPAFGAVPGVLSAIAAGRVPSADAGANAFAGDNVLSIVADLDVNRVLFTDDAGVTPLGVSAIPERP
jgi:hypothetical protein